MLTATSETRFGDSRILSALLLERRFRAFLIWRHRLVFDSRFALPAPGNLELATLYFALDGELAVADRPVTPPIAYVISAEELETRRPGRTTFRSWGDPAVSFELQLPSSHVTAPIGLEHGPLQLSEPTWAAVHEFVEAFAIARPIEPLLTRVLAGLVQDGVLVDTLANTIEPEPEWVTRLWNAMAPLYGSYTTAVSLFDLARQAGLSLRQLRRDVKAMSSTFALYGAGFRETIQVLRLRLAILLLSSHDVTIGEIAKRVGYSGLDALARAFRDNGLPPPNVVREAVLFPL